MPRRALRGGLVAAAGILAAASTGPAAGQASLTAALSLHDPVSGAAVAADDGRPVRLRVRLTDPVTGRPPRGVELLGWTRPAAPDNPGCEKAAQNYRATRRTPLGAVDLNGILLAAFNRDASLSVVDPKLNLYSSNLVAAHVLEAPPAAVAVSARQMRAYFAYPETGEIIAADLTGPDRSRFAEGLPGVRALAVAGDLWAGDDRGRVMRLAPDGRVRETHDLGPGAVTLATPDDDENDLVAAHTAAGDVALFDGAAGRALMKTRFSGPVAGLSVVGRIGVIAALRDEAFAELRYMDAPDAPVRIPLGARFARVATGPDARIALFYTPGESHVAIVDLALGRVAQPVALNGATVSAVTFTDNAAFILSHDGGFLGALDLATVALGKPAVLRKVDLGAKTERPARAERLLVPLFPSPQVIAVEPVNQTGWLVGEVASSVEMPPMDSIRLRGGIPESVHVVDRSFQEVETGVFETVWAFAPGPKELILTTYQGQLSTCVPFEVRGVAVRQALIPVALVPTGPARPVAGKPYEIAFRLIGPDDRPAPAARLRLLTPSMISGWTGEATAVADAEGVLRAEVTLPHPGPFVIQPLDLPPGLALRSALIVEAGEEGR